MSQENIEIVKAVFRGWDEAKVEGMLPYFHPDIEYLPMEESGVIRGHPAIRRYFDGWMEPWAEFRVGPTEFRATGDHVLNGVSMSGRGRGSGVEVAMEYWQVWLMRDGVALRFEEYTDRDEALEAAGLRE